MDDCDMLGWHMGCSGCSTPAPRQHFKNYAGMSEKKGAVSAGSELCV